VVVDDMAAVVVQADIVRRWVENLLVAVLLLKIN
jgi:hypothetical protein